MISICPWTHPLRGAVVSQNTKTDGRLLPDMTQLKAVFEYRVDIWWLRIPNAWSYDRVLNLSCVHKCCLCVFVHYFHQLFLRENVGLIIFFQACSLASRQILWCDWTIWNVPLTLSVGVFQSFPRHQGWWRVSVCVVYVSVETRVASCLTTTRDDLIWAVREYGTLDWIRYRRTTCWRVLRYLNLDNRRPKDQHLHVLPVKIL